MQADGGRAAKELALAQKEKRRRDLQAAATTEESHALFQDELAATLKLTVATGYEQARLSLLLETLDALERDEEQKESCQERRLAELERWTACTRTEIVLLSTAIAAQ